MALSSQDIQKIYLADLGRPADPAGLTHWQGKEDLSQVSDGFAQSDEYKSLHASQDPSHLVTAIYQNLFGHAPDSAALADWLKEIDSGQIKANQLGLAIADSAQGTDAAVLQAKLDAAQDFTGYLSAVAKMVGSAPMDLTAVRDAWADIKTSADVPSDFSILIQNHVSLDLLVQKVYVAYFGRPADPDGLEYCVTKAVDTNGDWAGIVAAFSSSAEAKALYNTSTDTDFVSAIYQNLFGRAPEEGGLKYWTDQLTEGKITRDMLPLAIANGAQDSDLTTEQQRITAADEFTQELQTTKHTADYDGSTTTAAAREWLYGIGPDKADLDAAKSSLSTLVSSFDHGKVQGKAVDSYIKGATVFIDSNGNGQLDTGEVSVTTDDSGKFVLPANAPGGTLIVEGGTNIATDQANTAVLKAPVGATVVSPITTLVQQMVESGAADSVEDAHDQLFASLGIPQVALSVFDPIQAALSGDDAVKAAAVTLESKAVQVANVLTVAEAALRGAGVSAAQAQTAVLQALASTIAGGTANLTKADTIQAVLQEAVTTAALSADKQATLTQAAADVAEVIAASNDLIQKAAAAYTEGTVTDAVTALSDVFKVATLVQTDIAPKVQEAVPTGNVQQVVNDYTGVNLTTNLASVTLGEITPDVPANEGSSVTGGGTTPTPPETGGDGGGGGPVPDTTPPTTTITSAVYAQDANILTITGTNFDTLLETGEDATIDIKGRLDWTKLVWDIDGGDDGAGNVSFALGDITSAKVVEANKLQVTLSGAKATALETTANFGGVTADKLDVTAGFTRDAAGNASSTDGVVDAPITIDTTPPTLLSAATSADGMQIILTYNEALDVANGPAPVDFAVKVNGNDRALAEGSPVTVTGSTVTLTLAAAVTSADADTVKVSYTDPTTDDDEKAIQDVAGNDAASLSNQTVDNAVDTTAPLISSGTFTEVEENSTIILSFNEGMKVTDATGLTVLKNGSDNLSVSGITVDADPTLIKITTSATLGASDYVKLSYDSTAGTITDTDDHKAGSMTFYIGGSSGNTISAGTGESYVRIEGNVGNDSLTGSNNSDVIIGGTGADTLTGRKYTDVFVFSPGDSGKPTATNFDVITDWNKDNVPDRLFFPGLSKVHNDTKSSGVAAIDTNGFASFDLADDTLAKCISAVEAGINAGGVAASGQFAVFEFNGDSYVFISDGIDGVTDTGNDVLIQLSGITGLDTSNLWGGTLSLMNVTP